MNAPPCQLKTRAERQPSALTPSAALPALVSQATPEFRRMNAMAVKVSQRSWWIAVIVLCGLLIGLALDRYCWLTRMWPLTRFVCNLVDINECESGFVEYSSCTPDEVCINTPGGYACNCKKGLQRNDVNLSCEGKRNHDPHFIYCSSKCIILIPFQYYLLIIALFCGLRVTLPGNIDLYSITIFSIV